MKGLLNLLLYIFLLLLIPISIGLLSDLYHKSETAEKVIDFIIFGLVKLLYCSVLLFLFVFLPVSIIAENLFGGLTRSQREAYYCGHLADIAGRKRSSKTTVEKEQENLQKYIALVKEKGYDCQKPCCKAYCHNEYNAAIPGLKDYVAEIYPKLQMVEDELGYKCQCNEKMIQMIRNVHTDFGDSP